MNPARAGHRHLGHAERLAVATDMKALLDPGREPTGDGHLPHPAERLMNLQHQLPAHPPAAIGHRASISADGTALAG